MNPKLRSVIVEQDSDVIADRGAVEKEFPVFIQMPRFENIVLGGMTIPSGGGFHLQSKTQDVV